MTPAEQLCRFAHLAYARQLVAGMEGNLSLRLPDGAILCTPTMRCKGLLTPEDLCVVDLDGVPVAHALSGRAGRRASSEMPMHLALYRANPAIGGVVHCHPPFATAFAVLGESIPAEFLPEAAIFFGEVPLAPYAMTGTPAMGAVLEPFARDHVAALLQNHGAVAWGRDLELAYGFMESLEAICRSLHYARQIGTPRKIAPEHLPALEALRARVKESLK
jgi:L-fuculose-phosphate aldolase